MALTDSDLPKLVELLNQIDIRVQQRGRTAADWVANNEVLLAREMGLETDTGLLKFGDGVAAWNSLGYFAGSGGGGGSGNVSYVAEAVVTGAAATTLSISGLNLSADQEYLVVLNLKNASPSSAAISLYYNGDTTDANYRRSYGTNSGTAAESNARVGTFVAGEVGYVLCNLKQDLNGRPGLALTAHRSTSVPAVTAQFQSTYYSTVANLVQLTLASSVASALAVGTKITVYKRSH